MLFWACGVILIKPTSEVCMFLCLLDYRLLKANGDNYKVFKWKVKSLVLKLNLLTENVCLV